MKTSESIKEIATALHAAQAEMGAAKKDSTNPHFKSSYADLSSVIDAIRKPLADNGLSFIQSPVYDYVNLLVGVETRIIHVSGEYISSSLMLPIGAKQTAQAAGSALTYAKRYSISSLCGLSTESDDDGNSASEAPAATPKKHTLDANAKGWVNAVKNDAKVLEQITDIKYREFIKNEAAK
jgi:hypothetical protein